MPVGPSKDYLRLFSFCRLCKTLLKGGSHKRKAALKKALSWTIDFEQFLIAVSNP